MELGWDCGFDMPLVLTAWLSLYGMEFVVCCQILIGDCCRMCLWDDSGHPRNLNGGCV